MGIVFLCGSHPRHAYIARQIAKSNLLTGLVVERREEFVPDPPAGLNAHTRDLYVAHFAGRAAAEERFFAKTELPAGVGTLFIEQSELNTAPVGEFIDRHKPELLMSYGVHKLSEETLGRAHGRRWNIHGGLSPWYRGGITLFWPSYFLEPQMSGMTVHNLTQAIDGGDIVHTVVAKLVRGDGLHDLACRAVVAVGEDLPKLVTAGVQNTFNTPVVQKTSGRIWRAVDWRPEHLHLIYDVYGNRIVDRYLDGEFMKREPKLVSGV